MEDQLGFEDLKGKNNYGNTGPVVLLVILLLAATCFGVYKQFFDKCPVCNSTDNKTEKYQEKYQEIINNFFKEETYYLGNDKKIYKVNDKELQVFYDNENVSMISNYNTNSSIFLTEKGNLYLINNKVDTSFKYLKITTDLTKLKIIDFTIDKTEAKNKIILTLSDNSTKEGEFDMSCNNNRITNINIVEYGTISNQTCSLD